MKVIPIVVDALRMISKRLVKELEDLEIRRQVQTIQTTALLRSTRILGRVLETNPSEKPSAIIGFGWLVVWVLWHINLCRLFNTKSIFMKIVLFQTIQFRISTQFKCKYSLIMKNISISSYSV